MADDPAKKLIIDEDWKSQVQAEKDALRSKQDSAEVNAESESPAEDELQLPEASFPLLLSMLATQALIALGQVPHPATGKPEFSPAEAKHFIDLLAVLEAKTEGNRTPEESLMLSNLLHELRMVYVSTGAAASSNAAGSSPPAEK